MPALTRLVCSVRERQQFAQNGRALGLRIQYLEHMAHECVTFGRQMTCRSDCKTTREHLRKSAVDYWQRLPAVPPRLESVPYVVSCRIIKELPGDFDTVSKDFGGVQALCDQRVQDFLQQVYGRNTDEFHIMKHMT